MPEWSKQSPTGTVTWQQFLLRRDASLGATVGQMLKCHWWLCGGLMCTICCPCALLHGSQSRVLDTSEYVTLFHFNFRIYHFRILYQMESPRNHFWKPLKIYAERSLLFLIAWYSVFWKADKSKSYWNESINTLINYDFLYNRLGYRPNIVLLSYIFVFI